MGRGNVKVVLRTRPTENFASEHVKLQDQTVNLFCPKKKGIGGVVNNACEHYSFKFDDVLHNASQDDTYDSTCQGVISNVLQGYNATVLVYGQTGAGKTYTMTGGENFKTRGLIPRAITDLFFELSHIPEKAFDVSVTYIEIYNERLYDLLSNEDLTSTQQLAIRETGDSMSVKGLVKKTAKTESEALAHLFDGNSKRATGNHILNSNSSRSHCIFTIHVNSKSRLESDSHTLTSKLNLVDLAGSERVGKTGSDGDTLKEAMSINKSLSFLEQVVVALGNSNRTHIPYRQSKLTSILKDSLGGNCRTVMVANMWGEAQHVDETLSTLKFATRMMKVHNEISPNILTDPASQIKALQRQVVELKAELQMQNQLHGKSHVKYDAFSDDERYELEKRVQEYLAGEIDEIEIRNLRDVKEYCRLFKACVTRASAETEERLKAEISSAENTEGANHNPSKQNDQVTPNGMGELDGAAGFGVGTGAASKSIRQNMLAQSPTHVKSEIGSPEAISPLQSNNAPDHTHKSVVLPDRGGAYEDYKLNEGAELQNQLREHTSSLREAKNLKSEKTALAQELKAEVETLKRSIELKSHDDNEEYSDADSYLLIEELKKKRIEFRKLCDEITRLRTDIQTTTKLQSQSRQILISNFETWYHTRYAQTSNDSGHTILPTSYQIGSDTDDLEFENPERALEQDPDSLEFYRAQKLTQSRKTKRGPGWVAARGGR